jgi:hypothetical protein
MAKWLVVARNEYKLKTSKIRKIRPYFHYILIFLVGLLVGVLAPLMANSLIQVLDIEGFFISVAALGMMTVVLFMFFFYFLLLPISTTLQDIETQEYEIFIAAPIKPGDILLGKFMGVVPFYAVGIAVITGFFTAFLIPLGIDFVQIALIIAIFVLTLLSAVWIGTVLAALARTKLGKSARGRDIGKALPLVIALPFIAIMYAIMGGGLWEALGNPETSSLVGTIMSFIPSSWGAELMVLFARNPGDTGAIWLETLSRFGGLVIFFIGSLWVGAKAADRAYSLETKTFSSAMAKADGRFYRTVKSLGGGQSFGTLLVSIFKDYARRFENISKIGYMVGLLVLINLFMVDADDPEGSLVMGIFIFPFLAAFIIGEVTIRGKENLFIYRKAPGGEGRLIKGRLMQGLLIVVPIALAYQSIVLLRFPGLELYEYSGFIVTLLALAGAYVAMALGLFLLMPVFSNKPAELMGNIMILMVTSMVLFIVSVILGPTYWAAMGILVMMVWILGTVLLVLGKRNLNKIE